MRRYLGLLVCLAVSIAAHAYNEEIASIAYNPSRVGAYNYLKTNTITLKSGLRVVGNETSLGGGYSTEVNLIGTVYIIDDNYDEHGKLFDVNKLNTITHIKPLSNYPVDATGHTFYTESDDWIKNNKARQGTTALSAKSLRGLGNSLDDYTGTGSDPALIPKLYMYGGEIGRLNTEKNLYSRVKAIQQMYISGSTLQEDNEFPTNLTLTTKDLVGNNQNNTLSVTEELTFGNINIPVSTGFTKCTNNQYLWQERITDKHVKVKILACK